MDLTKSYDLFLIDLRDSIIDYWLRTEDSKQKECLLDIVSTVNDYIYKEDLNEGDIKQNRIESIT